MSQKTINVSTLKTIINAEYQRAEGLYGVYKAQGNGRNADYYTSRMSALIDVAAQIEQATGATIFDDQQVEQGVKVVDKTAGEQCDNTLSDSSPVPTSQNRPAKSITTGSAAL